MKIKTAIVACCLFFASGCALSRDVVYLDDRINAIEKRMTKQKSTEQSTSKSIQQEYAKMNNRLDRFADQIRRIDGRLEENLYSQEKNSGDADMIRKDLDRINMLLAQVSRRIDHLQAYVGYDGKSGRMAAPAKTSGGAAVPVTGVSEETKLYNDAMDALHKEDMKGARDGFSKLLEMYPKSSQADNAQFWIGESYYLEKWYQKAILEYQKVIENYPKGNKIAAAYLKQGLAFFELGEADNAKLILNELLKKFPGSNEAEIAKKKLASNP